MVSALLEAGASADAPNGKGQTALDVARKLDALETSSAIESVYKLAEWRAVWGKPEAGRKRCIALLEQATTKEPAGGEPPGEAAAPEEPEEEPEEA